MEHDGSGVGQERRPGRRKAPRTGDEAVIIKKYANRRLYDTEKSSYVTLDGLAAMVREGRDFQVIDARTGDDITHQVLTQIIMDEETRGQTLLPVSVLRQLIALYGDQMQAMVPHWLEASMEALRHNQEQMRHALVDWMGPGSNPFEAMVRQNMALMSSAIDVWRRANPLLAGGLAAGTEGAPGAAQAEREVQQLRAELAELKAKLAEAERAHP